MSETDTEVDLSELEKLIEGSDAYSDNELYRYLLNFMTFTKMESKSAYWFCHAVEEVLCNEKIEGFPHEKKKKNKPSYPLEAKPAKNSVNEKDWEAIKAFLKEKVENSPDAEPTPFLSNLYKLSEYLGFTERERSLLKFIYVVESNDSFKKILTKLIRSKTAEAPVISLMCGEPHKHKRFEQFLSEQGKMVKFGVIEKDITGESPIPIIDLNLGARLQTPNLTKENIVDLLLGRPAKSDLEIEDFEYLGKELEFLKTLLKNASGSGQKGVNILIHGPAGGGKTELSKTLAKALGRSLYLIGENEGSDEEVAAAFDEDGFFYGYQSKKKEKGSTSKQRLADLHRAHGLLEGSEEALVLFDEIEDLLIKGTDSSKSSDTESKIEINRLLENNAIPTLWCGNDPDKFHDSVRQRFTFSLFIGYPPIKIRRNIWEKQLTLNNLELPKKDIDYLARSYDAAPRQIALALQSAKITGLGLKAIETSLSATSQITIGSREAIKDGTAVSKYFSPDLFNIKRSDVLDGEGAPQNYDDLIERGKSDKPFSLFVRGKKGMGMHAFSRHMSEEMVMSPLELSMVGLKQPTQFSTPAGNIMQAFAQAANSRSFLSIHELDTLAGDPAKADTWDESLLSVFVECAQRHPLPFMASARLNSGAGIPDKLQKILSDTIELKALTQDQLELAFKTYFGQDMPEGAKNMDKLTLTDFANVRRLLNKMDTTKLFASHAVYLLQKQRQINAENASSGKIGFHVTPSNDDNRSGLEQIESSPSAVPLSQSLK